MSKNRNRKHFNKANTNKEYSILQKGHKVYCHICVKRSGEFGATCGPVNWVNPWRRGFKNAKKAIATWQAREYRSWKYNRRTQWK